MFLPNFKNVNQQDAERMENSFESEWWKTHLRGTSRKFLFGGNCPPGLGELREFHTSLEFVFFVEFVEFVFLDWEEKWSITFRILLFFGWSCFLSAWVKESVIISWNEGVVFVALKSSLLNSWSKVVKYYLNCFCFFSHGFLLILC